MTIPAHRLPISKNQSGSVSLWVLIWLVGMAALAFFCLVRHAPNLELDTQNRISQVLTQASATGIAASVDGYTATLTGNVQNNAQKQQFLALAGGTPGVRTVIDELHLSGATIATANDDTPIVGKPIKLDTKNAGSDSTSTETTIAAANAPLAPDAADSAAEAEVANSVGSTTPAPIELVKIEANETEQSVAATNDPSIELEIEDGTLMLDGIIANSDNLNLLVDQAKKSLKIDFVSNSSLARDDTKRATWLEPIVALLPAMAQLEKPGISVEKNQITLKGLAPDQNTHDAVITRALQLLGDYSLVERINIAEAKPSSIQKLDEVNVKTDDETIDSEATEAVETIAEPASDTIVDTQPAASNTSTDPGEDIRDAFALLPSTRILFESGSAILTTQSQSVLDSIAQLLRDYPNAEMDIDGHTDAQGDDRVNLKLSQARANAVRDYLIDQDISVYRLAAYGFGEGVPIASNDNPEGRALNRRIEFKF